MEIDEIQIASGRLSYLKEEQNEIYERVKPYIKHFEEYDSLWDSLQEEIAYWQKANQIHYWFVETIHNGEDEPCFTQDVTMENLKQLNNLCLKVLMRRVHPDDILPTNPGCFFGGTAYDEHYYIEVYEINSKVAGHLENFNFETHYLLYQCSW